MEWKMEDISHRVYGKYQFGFIHAGFEWSDLDESFYHGGPKWGALSAPGPIRVRYVPGFRIWQFLGLISKGPRD